MTSLLAVEEIELTFPWGTMAAKWWGRKDVRPIVAVHGWQDNAGSFDTLIPLLSSDWSYLAIDLPGHGRTSHLPGGISYNKMDLIFVFNELMEIYRWPKISFLAHSMGSIAAFVFTALFPKKVDLIIALDTIKPQVFTPKVAVKFLQYQSENLLLADKRNRDATSLPPTYAYDELVDRVILGSMQSVDRDKAKYMIERAVVESKDSPGKFHFSRDIRVKYMFDFHFAQDLCLEMAKHIRIPHLFIRASDKMFSEHPKHIKEIVELLQRTNPHFQVAHVVGTHHMHLNSPELVAPHVNEFLRRHPIDTEIASKSKL